MWQHPFDKKTITSRFGETARRTNPHRGTDYAPGVKELIPAVTAGKVTKIFYSKCLGWVCEIKTDDGGYYVGHSHLYCSKHKTAECDGKDHAADTCMKNLKVGDKVTQGQPVGRVGNSGSCSRGAHLHITISKKSDPRYAPVFDIEKFIDDKIQAAESAPKTTGKQSKAILPKRTKKASTPVLRRKTGKPIGVCQCCGQNLKD